MKYLLDTCVISEIIRPQPDENVISWVQGKEGGQRFSAHLFLSNL